MIGLLAGLEIVFGLAPAALASPGTRAWVARFDGTGHGTDESYRMALNDDGARLYVIGRTDGGSTGDDYGTAAYDALTGSELWLSTYDGFGSFDTPSDVALSPDGTAVYVTGSSAQGPGSLAPTDFLTVAYDALTGAELWTARFDENHQDQNAYGVAVSPDGRTVYVTGESFGRTGYDYATIAYDAGTGSRRWAAHYNGPSDFQDAAFVIRMSPDGSRVFVSGWSSADLTGYDIATLAYDAGTGQQLWVDRYDGTGSDLDLDRPTGMVVSEDGATVFVAGHAKEANETFDYVVIANDGSTGHERWVSTYDGPGHGQDYGGTVAISPDGARLFMTGSSDGLGDTWGDMATVALDAVTGAQLWVARYSGPGNFTDGGTDVAVGPDGRLVFVAGYAAPNAGSTDVAVFVYSASSGRGVWRATYDGPGHGDDEALAIAVAPGGDRWYVTGPSDGLSNADWATVAYRS